MSKEEILKGFRSEFSEYLRPKTIGVFDAILLANQFEEYLEKAINQTREETIREVEEILDNYFKGLIVVPYPELTRDQIKKHINKLRK